MSVDREDDLLAIIAVLVLNHGGEVRIPFETLERAGIGNAYRIEINLNDLTDELVLRLRPRQDVDGVVVDRDNIQHGHYHYVVWRYGLHSWPSTKTFDIT